MLTSNRAHHNNPVLNSGAKFKYCQLAMPKTGTKLEDYEVLATIGTGSFGTCKKVRRKKDRKVSHNDPGREGGEL